MPENENANAIPAQGERQVSAVGCLEPHGEGVVLRVGSGHSRESTTANGPWLGTRSYLLDPESGVEAGEHGGAMVRVEGSIHTPAVRAAGTDQMQASRGAVLERLRPSSITALDESCGRFALRNHARYSVSGGGHESDKSSH